MSTKSFWVTKSFWAQVVTGLAQLLVWAGVPGLQEWLTANPESAMMLAGGLQAVVAWIMRLVTDEPAKL